MGYWGCKKSGILDMRGKKSGIWDMRGKQIWNMGNYMGYGIWELRLLFVNNTYTSRGL